MPLYLYSFFFFKEKTQNFFDHDIIYLISKDCMGIICYEYEYNITLAIVYKSVKAGVGDIGEDSGHGQSAPR